MSYILYEILSTYFESSSMQTGCICNELSWLNHNCIIERDKIKKSKTLRVALNKVFCIIAKTDCALFHTQVDLLIDY